MPVWTIMWALVFVTPDGRAHAAQFEQAAPSFESVEECMTYLKAMEPFLEARITKDFEFPPETQYLTKALCKSSRPA